MDAPRGTRAANLILVGVFAGLAALATVCGSQGAASVPKSGGPEATAVAVEASQAREQRIALAEEAVRHGKYELPDIGAFELKDGNFQEKYGEGASQVKRVGVVTAAFGDLDGDKVEDAAVVLWANTGGSGTFIYLAPVLNKDGKGQQTGAQLLGDRVQIKSLVVNSGRIRIEELAQGSTDPMVSPTLQSVQEYALQSGKLSRLSPADATAPAVPRPTQQPVSHTPQPTETPAPRPSQQPTSQPARVAPSGLMGTVWIWQRFVDSSEKGTFLADSGEMVFGKLTSVTGKIVGPAGTTAPADGTAEVMIVNSAGQQIGGAMVQAQLPMQFEAPFKPANIDPSSGYTLEVTIKDAQKNVVFRNSRPYPVLTRGNPTYHLEVEVERTL